MANGLRGKARESKGIVTVKVLMTHPMEPGTRKNKETGDLIPAHYIENVIFKIENETIYTANFGGAISKDPFLSFKYKGTKGNKIQISWKDNQQQSGETEIRVK